MRWVGKHGEQLEGGPAAAATDAPIWIERFGSLRGRRSRMPTLSHPIAFPAGRRYGDRAGRSIQEFLPDGAGKDAPEQAVAGRAEHDQNRSLPHRAIT